MPLIDLPLDGLHAYMGRNPRPDDFDAYWDKAMAEMRAVDAGLTLTPAEPFGAGPEDGPGAGSESEAAASIAACHDLMFTGVGGARVYAKHLAPVGPPPAGGRPAVLFFHGYGVQSSDWTQYFAYVLAGCVVVAMDCRGQGGRSEDVGGVSGPTRQGHIVRGLEDAPEKLLYRSIFLDTAQLAGLVMNMDGVDPTRVMAQGASQGGGLTLACAALEPRIAKIAPVYPFLCDYQRVWEMDLDEQAYGDLRDFFRQRDPRHERVGEWFRRLGYIDNQHLAPRIQATTLMATGLMDRICPPSTQFAAYNKITAPKELVVYPDYAHERLEGWADKAFGFLMR